jgi:phosphoglycerate dehydrogenase-like enzyme
VGPAPWGGPAAGGADAAPREVGSAGARGGRAGIGGAVAGGHALGATCVGVRRGRRRRAAGFERVVGRTGWTRSSPGADVVVLAAPSTPETDGLLGARRIALLGRGRSS